MIKVTNTNEMYDTLNRAVNEPVQFPYNANILLGYDEDVSTMEEIERLGRDAGRSVHLRLVS